MPRILGIDPGLATTGWAIVDTDRRHVEAAGKWTTKTTDEGRVATLGTYFHTCIDVWAPDGIAIEAWTYQGRIVTWQASLVPRVIERFCACADERHLPVVEVPTTQAKASIGLKGRVPKSRVPKSRVREAVARIFTGAKLPNEHARDAVVVAFAGASLLRQKALLDPDRSGYRHSEATSARRVVCGDGPEKKRPGIGGNRPGSNPQLGLMRGKR